MIIFIYMMQAQHFKFIHCLERLTIEGRYNEWFNCFQMTGLGTLPIDCYKSGKGKSVSYFKYFFFLILLFSFKTSNNIYLFMSNITD